MRPAARSFDLIDVFFPALPSFYCASGGGEESNRAIRGVVCAGVVSLPGQWRPNAHIITSAVEHPATLRPCEFLNRAGCRITILPVDNYGMVDPDSVRQAIDRR